MVIYRTCKGTVLILEVLVHIHAWPWYNYNVVSSVHISYNVHSCSCIYTVYPTLSTCLECLHSIPSSSRLFGPQGIDKSILQKKKNWRTLAHQHNHYSFCTSLLSCMLCSYAILWSKNNIAELVVGTKLLHSTHTIGSNLYNNHH